MLQRTALNWFKLHSTCAAGLFFIIQPMKVEIRGVVVAVSVVNAEAP